MIFDVFSCFFMLYLDGWRLERADSKDAVLQEIWYRASEGSITHFKVLAELGCLDAED